MYGHKMKSYWEEYDSYIKSYYQKPTKVSLFTPDYGTVLMMQDAMYSLFLSTGSMLHFFEKDNLVPINPIA